MWHHTEAQALPTTFTRNGTVPTCRNGYFGLATQVDKGHPTLQDYYGQVLETDMSRAHC